MTAGVPGSPVVQLDSWEYTRTIAVLRTVERRTGVSADLILGRSKVRAHREARRLLEYGLRHQAGLSWVMIGRILGRLPKRVADNVALLELHARRHAGLREELDGLMEDLRS